MSFSLNPFGKKTMRPETESLSVQYEKAVLGGVKRVLFLEDDEALRRYLVERIEPEYRIEFVCCHRSGDAQKQLDADYFHAAILDIKVANGGGIWLYRKIMDTFPALRVIFLTGYDSLDHLREIGSIGPAAMMSKDNLYQPDFIEKLMAQLGVRKRGMSPI